MLAAMRRSGRRWLLGALALAAAAAATAAEVRNVRAYQQENRLVVEYDLDDEQPGEVAAVLAANGRLYAHGALRLEGDVGRAVTPGKDRRFTWDVLKDFPRGLGGEVFVAVQPNPKRPYEADAVSLSERQTEVFRRLDAERIDVAAANRRMVFRGAAATLAPVIDDKLRQDYYQEIDAGHLEKSRYYCGRFPEPAQTIGAAAGKDDLAARWMPAQSALPTIADENHERYFNCLLGSFDPHSAYLTPQAFRDMQVATKGTFGGLGIEVGVVKGVLTVVSPLEDTPAFRAGIQAGDRIQAIDWRSTQDLPLNDAVKLMRGLKGTKVTLTIQRDGVAAPFPVTLVRDVITVRSVRARLLDGGYGYVRISQFQERTPEDFARALASFRGADGGIKGLVLDLRNDPGGLLQAAIAVASHFVNRGLIVYTQGRTADANQQYAAQPIAREPNYPIVVLINRGSASASEIVAGALQDHRRALVAGTRSFGKGSVQTIVPVADGAVKLTTAIYYTPNGRSIQQIGIVPDVPLELDAVVDDAAAAIGRRLLVESPALADAAKRQEAIERVKLEEFFTLYRQAARSSLDVAPPAAKGEAAAAKTPEQGASTSAAVSASEQRVALVIGNAGYPSAPLRNPVNDARAMSAKLKTLGFQVIARENVGQKDMMRAITQFGEKLGRKGTVGLFYYAGHGMQVKGKNYLIPVDAQISTEASVRSEAVDVDSLLEQLATSTLGLVILDACRNNPFERRFRSVGGGLAQMDAPKGTLIAYATAPGKVAADGTGHNGLYTQELLKVLDERGLKVEDVFKRVRRQVADATGDQQVPWESSSLTGDFFFVRAAVRTPPPADAELVFWQSVRESKDVDDFRAYLRRYPSGQFADIAKNRIRQIGGK